MVSARRLGMGRGVARLGGAVRGAYPGGVKESRRTLARSESSEYHQAGSRVQRAKHRKGRDTLYLTMAGLALRRPSLIPHLLGAAWAFRSRYWYRRPPFLPLPSRTYLRWRMDTAYGDPDARPPADETERFLGWSTDMRRRMRERRG